MFHINISSYDNIKLDTFLEIHGLRKINGGEECSEFCWLRKIISWEQRNISVEIIFFVEQRKISVEIIFLCRLRNFEVNKIDFSSDRHCALLLRPNSLLASVVGQRKSHLNPWGATFCLCRQSVRLKGLCAHM